MAEEKKEKKDALEIKNTNRNIAIIIICVILVFVIAAVILYANRNKFAKKVNGGDTKASEAVFKYDSKKKAYTISDRINYDDLITLGDYKGVSLKKADVKQKVKDQINSTLANYATYKKIKDGKVKNGDTVNIFYVGKIDGKKFDGGSLTKKDSPDGYNLTIGSKTFIDGFEDQLIGKEIGKTYDIKVTFPKNYSANSDLAGKEAVFTVTLNYKQGKQILPELTDKFVKKNLSSYKSVKDMKKQIRKSVITNLSWTAVSDGTKVKKYADGNVDQMYKQLYSTYTSYAEASGTTLADYLKQNNVSSTDFKEEVMSRAKELIKNQYIALAIANKEKTVISKADYDAEIKKLITSYSAQGVTDEKSLASYYKKQYKSDIKDVVLEQLFVTSAQDVISDNVKVG